MTPRRWSACTADWRSRTWQTSTRRGRCTCCCSRTPRRRSGSQRHGASNTGVRHRVGNNARVSHSHVHTSAKRPLAIALGLIVGLMAGEIVFGVVAGSLALLADAAALTLALGAVSLAGRPARGRWTFGFRRLEILAAHVNGITLLVVGVVIVYTAVRRLIDPSEVRRRRARRRARRDRRQPRRGGAAARA